MSKQVQAKPEVFYAFCNDSKNGRVTRLEQGQLDTLQRAAREGNEQAIAVLKRLRSAMDEATTATNQMAGVGSIEGVQGLKTSQQGDDPKIIQDSGIDQQALQTAIKVIEEVLAAAKAKHAKQQAATGTQATGASTEDTQGWGGEGQTNASAANATGESYDQTAPSLQNPNNAIAQRLDRDTESFTGDEVEEAAANMLAKMGQDAAAHALIFAGTETDPFGEHAAASANAAARTAFDARARAQRAKVIGDLKSHDSAYAAGFRSSAGKGMDASQDAAEAAMRAAGIQLPRRGYAFVPG